MTADIDKALSETEKKRILLLTCRKLYEAKLEAIDERAREEAQTGIEMETCLRGIQKEIEQLEKEKREVEESCRGAEIPVHFLASSLERPCRSRGAFSLSQ